MPTVSIIIPVYNGEKYLKEAINSAINQTYKDIEVIVCNDASTDTTRKILQEYEDEGKITVYHHDWNAGTAATLNRCIEKASGDWIKWLSADDVLLPDAVELFMSDTRDDDTIFYTDYHIIDKDGKYKKDFVEPVQPIDNLWKFFYGNGSTSFIHKNVFKKCGLFDESIAHSEDYEFWLRATMLYDVKLTLLPYFSINYRNHPGQLTNKVGGKLDKQIKNSIMQRLPAQ